MEFLPAFGAPNCPRISAFSQPVDVGTELRVCPPFAAANGRADQSAFSVRRRDL